MRVIREVRAMREFRGIFARRFGGFKKKQYLCAQ